MRLKVNTKGTESGMPAW